MYQDLRDLQSRFSSELVQLWQYYQPKFTQMIYDKFQTDYNSKWKEIFEEQKAAINVQNEIIRTLEKRIESLEISMGGIRP